MRRFALLLSCSAGLLLPTSATADLAPPLRTLCLSSTMEYCVGFIAWEYEYELALVVDRPEGPVSLYNATVNATLNLFGSGWTRSPSSPLRLLPLATFSRTGQTTDIFAGPVGIIGPGIVTYSTTEPNIRTPDPASVHHNLISLRVQEEDDFTNPIGVCSPRARPHEEGACYEVPEPGSALLAAVGMLGLVYLRRRRCALEA